MHIDSWADHENIIPYEKRPDSRNALDIVKAEYWNSPLAYTASALGFGVTGWRSVYRVYVPVRHEYASYPIGAKRVFWASAFIVVLKGLIKSSVKK